jgi:hypothetical protein
MITKFPHYVRLPMRICVGTVVLLGLGNSPSSAQTQTEGLTDNQISTLNTCVDNIYNQMISNSVSTCESPSLYLAAGATDFNSQTYTLRPPTNYQIVAGSASYSVESGECTYGAGARTNGNTVQCLLYTGGCGTFGAGGNVWARCGAKVQYIPQIADMVNIKRYCFGQLYGVSLPLPGKGSVACALSAQ